MTPEYKIDKRFGDKRTGAASITLESEEFPTFWMRLLACWVLLTVRFEEIEKW